MNLTMTMQETNRVSRSPQHMSTKASTNGLIISTCPWSGASIISLISMSVRKLSRRSVRLHFMKSTYSPYPGDMFLTCIRIRLIAPNNDYQIALTVPSCHPLVTIALEFLVLAFSILQKHSLSIGDTSWERKCIGFDRQTPLQSQKECGAFI